MPTPKQMDHWLGHDERCQFRNEGTEACCCEPWRCRSCGQVYAERDGHDCPARSVEHLPAFDVFDFQEPSPLRFTMDAPPVDPDHLRRGGAL